MANIFSDFDAAFTLHPTTKDIPIKADVEAIKFSVKSLILTNHFERPFQSQIGSGIRGMLFELMGPMTNIVIREEISQVLDNYEPRIDVTDIVIIPEEDSNSLYVTIKFVIKNTTREYTVNVALERTR
jgi:phage baseplate assembly protein W